MMLINPFVYNSIDEYTKSWMLFSTLDDLVVDNTWSGGTLTGGKLVGSITQNTLADQSRFNINTGDFTIEFDYTPDATDNNGSNHGLLSFSQDSLATVSYFIRYNAGLMMVSYPSAGGSAEIPVYNTTALTTGQEYRVVFQRKAGVYDLLVDGVSNVTARNNSALPFNDAANDLYVGVSADGGFSEYMSGSMDHFKFSNGVARY